MAKHLPRNWFHCNAAARFKIRAVGAGRVGGGGVGGRGGVNAMAAGALQRSVDPKYLNKEGGADYAHHITTCPLGPLLRIFRRSYGPEYFLVCKVK